MVKLGVRQIFDPLLHITICGLYYKDIIIANDDSRVIRKTLQVVASPMIVILTTLEVSFMLLDNIYTKGIPYDHHLQSSRYSYSPGANVIKLFLSVINGFS
jgi:hypothetical protein